LGTCAKHGFPACWKRQGAVLHAGIAFYCGEIMCAYSNMCRQIRNWEHISITAKVEPLAWKEYDALKTDGAI
jgi:hypothetical protein